MGRLADKFIAQQTRILIKKRGLQFYIDYYAQNIDGYDVKAGKRFKTTEEEVDDFIRDVPELKSVRDTLIKLTKNARVKAELPE
jgi:hypothetical protein